MTQICRDSPAVGAPRGAGDVCGPIGQRKTMTEAISAGSASLPSGRPAATFASTVPVALLLGEPTFSEPGFGRRRPRRHGVAADAVVRMDVGNEPREREERRLHHRVVRHRRRRPLARARRDVHDCSPPSAGAAAQRGSRARRSSCSARTTLPVGVGQVVERVGWPPATLLTRQSTWPKRSTASPTTCSGPPAWRGRWRRGGASPRAGVARPRRRRAHPRLAAGARPRVRSRPSSR